jgi:hypothetical protein
MDPGEIINILKKIETQVEYLRNVENLLERVVRAEESILKILENMQSGGGAIQPGAPGTEKPKNMFGL